MWAFERLHSTFYIAFISILFLFNILQFKMIALDLKLLCAPWLRCSDAHWQILVNIYMHIHTICMYAHAIYKYALIYVHIHTHRGKYVLHTILQYVLFIKLVVAVYWIIKHTSATVQCITACTFIYICTYIHTYVFAHVIDI